MSLTYEQKFYAIFPSVLQRFLQEVGIGHGAPVNGAINEAVHATRVAIDAAEKAIQEKCQPNQPKPVPSSTSS